MKAFNDYFERHPLLVFCAVLLIVFLVVRNASATKKAKETEVNQIREAIASGEGADGVDIKSLVRGITPATGYSGNTAAKAIHEARSYINDDEEAVFSAFRNKTIGQIAAIVKSFQALYGLDIDNYLYSGNILTTFLSEAEYKQVLGIVQAARARR